MKSLLFLLLGALTASLAWNVVQLRDAAARAEAEALSSEDRSAEVLSVEALGLSEAQLETLTSCCGDCCATSDAIRTDLAAEEAALQKSLGADPRDPAEIERRIDRVGALRRELYETSMQTVLQVRDVLTPEQLELLRNCCCGPTSGGQ